MRLGDFLNTTVEGHVAAPLHPVTFKAIKRGKHGEEYVIEMKAVLAFVDEKRRDDAIDAAEAAIRRVYPDGNTPAEKRSNEIAYQVLLRALRDGDDPRVQFAENVEQLRSVLVQRVATHLYGEYLDFVDEEFPEVITPEQFAELVEAARKKSLSDLLTSTDYWTLRRALPGLVAHFGKSLTLTSGAGAPA